VIGLLSFVVVILAAAAVFLLSSAVSYSSLQQPVVDQQFWVPLLQLLLLQQVDDEAWWSAFRHAALVGEDLFESHVTALVCIPTTPNVFSILRIRPVLPQAPAKRSAC
jgi:hypothetical protein